MMSAEEGATRNGAGTTDEDTSNNMEDTTNGENKTDVGSTADQTLTTETVTDPKDTDSETKEKAEEKGVDKDKDEDSRESVLAQEEGGAKQDVMKDHTEGNGQLTTKPATESNESVNTAEVTSGVEIDQGRAVNENEPTSKDKETSQGENVEKPEKSKTDMEGDAKQAPVTDVTPVGESQKELEEDKAQDKDGGKTPEVVPETKEHGETPQEMTEEKDTGKNEKEYDAQQAEQAPVEDTTVTVLQSESKQTADEELISTSQATDEGEEDAKQAPGEMSTGNAKTDSENKMEDFRDSSENKDEDTAQEEEPGTDQAIGDGPEVTRDESLEDKSDSTSLQEVSSLQENSQPTYGETPEIAAGGVEKTSKDDNVEERKSGESEKQDETTHVIDETLENRESSEMPKEDDAALNGTSAADLQKAEEDSHTTDDSPETKEDGETPQREKIEGGEIGETEIDADVVPQTEGKKADVEENKQDKETLLDDKSKEKMEEAERSRIEEIGKGAGETTKEEKKEEEEAQSSNTSFFMGAILIVLLLIGCSAFSSTPESNVVESDSPTRCPLTQRSDRSDFLTQGIDSLREQYPALEASVWEVVAGASWTHVYGEQELTTPVVLLLVGQPGQTNANDVGAHVANMYARLYAQENVIRMDGANLKSKPSESAKLDMDKQIKDGFEGCARVVLITDVDKLPACSAILFHGYCDNSNAPVKDAVIVFTMTMAKELPAGASGQEIERDVLRQLETRWSQCPEEFPKHKIVAMQSRVANNIVILQ